MDFSSKRIVEKLATPEVKTLLRQREMYRDFPKIQYSYKYDMYRYGEIRSFFKLKFFNFVISPLLLHHVTIMVLFTLRNHCSNVLCTLSLQFNNHKTKQEHRKGGLAPQAILLWLFRYVRTQ